MLLLPTAASFLISESCNLGCKYCFELPERDSMSCKNMPDSVIEAGIDYLFNNIIKDENSKGDIELLLFGGEPLLNFHGVEKILSYAAEKSIATGIPVHSGLITNVTLLEEYMVPILKKYVDMDMLNIQLSVDGIKEIQDTVRVFKNGKGTFDIIESKMPLVKEIIKDSTSNRDAATVHSSMTKIVLPHMFESYIYFTEKWGIPGTWFMPIHQEEWDDNDVDIYEEQLNKIADYIIKRCDEENSIKKLIDFAPLNKAVKPKQENFGIPCGAGRGFISITASGDIYPCHQFYYIKDTKENLILGNVWDGIDESKRAIFKEYDGNDLTCHSKLGCTAYHCYICIAENYADNKSILSGKISARCKMTWVEQKILNKLRNKVENSNYKDLDMLSQGDGMCDIFSTSNRADINSHFSLIRE